MTLPNVRCAIFALAVLATSASAARGQWSSDPSANLVICDRSGGQAYPKIAATADGGCYVSWFDNSAGGYDVRLQRLDALGYEQWVHDGILVADRSLGWIQDYRLDVDPAGNAVLAFCDDRGGTERITASRIGPDGTLLWGTDGVQVSGQTDVVLCPRIAATSDGGYVVGWSKTSETPIHGSRGERITVELQKLDADGNPCWGDGVTLADELGLGFMLVDLKAADRGGVIVSWIRQGTALCPRHLWAQKLSGDGSTLWDSGHVVVFDRESIKPGHFPMSVPDGSGGAVFAWCFATAFGDDCAVQRILADGSEWFAHNGMTASTAPRPRTSPAVSFNPVTDEILLFWEEQQPDPSGAQYAVYGQKLFAARGREWTDFGRAVVPFSPGRNTPICSLNYRGGALVFFDDTLNGGAGLQTARLDTNGEHVWSPSVTFTGASHPWRLEAALSANEIALVTWTDGGAIYGQNVNPDGSLGLFPGDLDGDCDVDLADLAQLLANYDTPGGASYADGDLDGDEDVDLADLAMLLATYGAACT